MGDVRRKSEMHRCEVCQTWLKNHPAVIAMHEQGQGHKQAVARSLHEMRVKAEKEKAEAVATKKALAEIDKAATAQYERDRAAAEAARRALGSWDEDESGHLYNATLRYYYNKDNGMYYGGDPPAWTTTPTIPLDARYERLSAATAASPALPKATKTATATTTTTTTTTAAAATTTAVTLGRKIEKSAHPLASIGGYRPLPTKGTIGGARGVGVIGGGVSKPAASKQGAGKASSGAKAMSKEEQEAIRKREEARARLATRNAAAFGM